MESIWASDFGDRYWSLVRSGIQKEPLNPEEELKKHAATRKLNPSVGGGFGTPGAINALLVAMTLFEPGSMRITNPEQKLPRGFYPIISKFLLNLSPAWVIISCEDSFFSL